MSIFVFCPLCTHKAILLFEQYEMYRCSNCGGKYCILSDTDAIIQLLIENGYSSNTIQKNLQHRGLCIRRKTLLKEIREIKGVKINEKECHIKFTPIKYLTEEEKYKKYLLLLDKIKDKAYKKGEIERRKAAKAFMKTDNYEEDRELMQEEKVGNGWNELSKYMKYDLEMK